MPATTSFAPILPGKLEMWLEAVAEMKGPRNDEFEDLFRRLGIHREFVSLQRTPDGDFVVIYLEADDPDTVNDRIMTSDHPFDWWLASVFKESHGMDPSQDPPPPNEIIVDWTASR